MKKQAKKIDVGTPEGKQLLLQLVQSIQRVDNNLKMLKDERADILNRAKEEGFNKSMINKAIKQIREEQETNNVKDMEKEIYYTILKEANIISSVK